MGETICKGSRVPEAKQTATMKNASHNIKIRKKISIM